MAVLDYKFTLDQPWIGVDLDGTFAEYHGWRGIGHIGKPIPLMVNRVRDWIVTGKRVKIMTARVSTDIEASLPAVAVIHNYLFNLELPKLEVTCVKDYLMVQLWDDRAVSVKENTGIAVDANTSFDPIY